MSLLTPNQVAAAQALVALLAYQSGHAQHEALGFPDDVAAAIASHGQDRIHGAQAIKDELSRLYDRRRDSHARSIADEMKHQQHVLAARIVLERELACTPDQSLAATSLLNAEELASAAALATEPNCKEQVEALVKRSADRHSAAADAANLAHAEGTAQADEAAARIVADAEEKSVEEARPAE